MATKGERQALIFLAAVAMLGAGTRVYRARHVTVDPAGLDRQIAAVDSVKPVVGRRIRRPTGKRQPDDRSGGQPDVPTNRQPSSKIDLDTAPLEEIEKLPGIGPALAGRIIGDRTTNGPFGCLEALDGVKGIGPALLKRLDSLATFSGPGRPGCVRDGGFAAEPSGRAEGGPPRR